MSDEWRETTDPDELAAAVAAGVTVEFATGPDSWSQTRAPHIGGVRYRVPAWWVWGPEWRETQDPDELAAAAAAGVTVEYQWNVNFDWSESATTTFDHFGYFVDLGARYRVPAWWVYAPPSYRTDAVALLRDLQDAACAVISRPDVLAMLHGQTRHGLSDLVVDLAMALDSLVVMS